MNTPHEVNKIPFGVLSGTHAGQESIGEINILGLLSGHLGYPVGVPHKTVVNHPGNTNTVVYVSTEQWNIILSHNII